MPKALLLITQMETAGGQRAMMQHARELGRRGWDVRCVTFYDKGDFVPFFEETYNLPVVNLRAWKKGGSVFANGLRIVGGVFRLLHMMLFERFDVFHAFTHYSNIIGVPLAFVARIPVRISCQAVTTDHLPRWFKWFDRWIANSRLTSCMVAVSQTTHDDSVARVGIREEKIVTIPNAPELEPIVGNPSDVREELGLPPDSVLALVVARLHPLKGHRYLFEAYKALDSDEQKRFYILCAGDGEARPDFEVYLEEQGIQSHIRLLGARYDIPRLLRDVNFTILPSLSEGMPMCVLESLLASRPVLATTTDGVKEVITPACGILVPPAEAGALTTGLRRMLSSDLETMGAAGLLRVEEVFSLKKQVDDYIRLYARTKPSLIESH